MLDRTVQRRSALRRLLALATKVVELPPGAKVFARTSDASRTGCHVATLNPLPNGLKARRRVTHHDEVFEGLLGLSMSVPAWAWALRLKPSPRKSRPSSSDGSRPPKNIESLYALHKRRLALTGQFETSAT